MICFFIFFWIYWNFLINIICLTKELPRVVQLYTLQNKNYFFQNKENQIIFHIYCYSVVNFGLIEK